MRITVNGTEQDIPEESTVEDLLRAHGLEPSSVVAELNREILERDLFSHTRLQPGDILELLHFVGGG